MMWKGLEFFWDLANNTWTRFSEVKGSEAAAAIAYYTLFSLFPTLVLLTVISLNLLKEPRIFAHIMNLTQQFFPGSEELIQTTLHQLIAVKGVSIWSWGGAFGFGALLWSATGVFAGIAQNINQAWHFSTPRHFLMERVIAVIVITVLTTLLGISFFFTTALQFFQGWAELQPHLHFLYAFQSFTTRLLLWLIPVIITLVVFFLLYWLIPQTPVLWREAAWGALFATILGEITKAVFVYWYFYLGATGFKNVYGGLAAVVGLMVWVYFYSLIILLGANLSASIAFSTRLNGEK